MDVHRCRFVAYPAHAITAAAFTRAHDDDFPPNQPAPALRLALGRKNGDLEIWNPQNGHWIQESVFPAVSAAPNESGEGSNSNNSGSKSIDGLLWTQDPDDVDAEGTVVPGRYRLFSIASSPAVTEWDLRTGTPAHRSSGNFSQVWCFAAQPRWRAVVAAAAAATTGEQEEVEKESSGATEKKASRRTEETPRASDIVAGCVNGTLVLLSTADGQLQFKRTFVGASGKKAGCMSIVYQHRDRVVAGFVDGMIRVLDVRNGQTIRSMGLGIGIPGAPKSPYVWKVECLKNGDIVSGDSNGEVKFWDGKMYSLTQNVAGHETDCLDLAVSADGKTVFSGSMDGRIAVFRHTTNPAGRASWAKGTHRRIHDGEVKSIAAYDGKRMSVVVTGGIDATPIVNPLREFGKERMQWLPSLPQEPPMTSARHGRLLVSWWDRTISIWRITKHSTHEDTAEPQLPRKLVAKMELDTIDKVRHVSVSDDGRTLVAATSSEVKVFQLRRRLGSPTLGIRRLSVPEKIRNSGARLTGFSPDGKWLVCVMPDSDIYIMRIASVPNKPKLLRIAGMVELERDAAPEDRQTGFADYSRSITRLAFAADSSILVTGDLSGNLDSWFLEGHEDLTKPAIDIVDNASDDEDSDVMSDASSDSSDEDDDGDIVFYGQRWTDSPAGYRLPRLDSAPIVLSFRPPSSPSPTNPGSDSDLSSQHRLWVVTAQHQMSEFDVRAGRLSDWSRRHPTSSLPASFARLQSRIMGAVWDVTSRRQRIWLYGTHWLLMLNVDDNVSYSVPSSELDPTTKTKKKKRGAERHHDGSAGKRSKTSGAGDKHRPAYRHGVPSSVRRLEDGAWTDVDLDRAPAAATHDAMDVDEDADPEASLSLTRLRAADAAMVDGEAAAGSESSTERLSWIIHKYRPILGVVPLGDVVRQDPDEPLEIVVVERTLSDARSRAN